MHYLGVGVGGLDRKRKKEEKSTKEKKGEVSDISAFLTKPSHVKFAKVSINGKFWRILED